jgi:hypothetical protein
MAKVCTRCRKKLGFLDSVTKEGLCYSCNLEVRKAKAVQINSVIDYIAKTRTINDKQCLYLESLDPSEHNKVYVAIVDRLLAGGELNVTESNMLRILYQRLNLDPVKSTFVNRIVPSYYVAVIRKNGSLPKVSREDVIKNNIILKKGEVPHFTCACLLKESKIVKTGFSAASQGVSFRVARGISYRVGRTQGHVIKEEQLVETSRGVLLVTNKRLFLYPVGNTKPVSIPINKILSYKCYIECVILYKEGREKPFVFVVGHQGDSETIGICLSYLTGECE